VVKKSDRKTYVWGSVHKALGNPYVSAWLISQLQAPTVVPQDNNPRYPFHKSSFTSGYSGVQKLPALRGSNPGRSASRQSLLWRIHSGCSTIKSRKLHREFVCKTHGRCLSCNWRLSTLCPTPKLKRNLPLAIRDFAYNRHLRHGCALLRWQGTHLT